MYLMIELVQNLCSFARSIHSVLTQQFSARPFVPFHFLITLFQKPVIYHLILVRKNWKHHPINFFSLQFVQLNFQWAFSLRSNSTSVRKPASSLVTSSISCFKLAIRMETSPCETQLREKNNNIIGTRGNLNQMSNRIRLNIRTIPTTKLKLDNFTNEARNLLGIYFRTKRSSIFDDIKVEPNGKSNPRRKSRESSILPLAFA